MLKYSVRLAFGIQSNREGQCEDTECSKADSMTKVVLQLGSWHIIEYTWFFFFRRGPETTPINKDVHISDWTAVVQRAHAPHRTSCVQLETAWFLSYTLSSAHLRLGFLLTQSILWLLSRFLNVDKAPYLPALASTNITICRSLLLESITFAV